MGPRVPEDHALVKSYVDMVDAAGGTVSFVELSADLDERLIRNSTELRLAEKRSKRDPDFSRANVLELEKKHVMNTGGAPTLAEELISGHPFLRVDNTRLSATDVAERIARALELPSPAPGVQ